MIAGATCWANASQFKTQSPAAAVADTIKSRRLMDCLTAGFIIHFSLLPIGSNMLPVARVNGLSSKSNQLAL